MACGQRPLHCIVVSVLITAFSYYWSEKLIVGDAEVGSNLLYPSSRYNQDSVRINQNLPLINPLYIMLEGEKRPLPHAAAVPGGSEKILLLHDEKIRGSGLSEFDITHHGHAPEAPRGRSQMDGHGGGPGFGQCLSHRPAAVRRSR